MTLSKISKTGVFSPKKNWYILSDFNFNFYCNSNAYDYDIHENSRVSILFFLPFGSFYMVFHTPHFTVRTQLIGRKYIFFRILISKLTG